MKIKHTQIWSDMGTPTTAIYGSRSVYLRSWTSSNCIKCLKIVLETIDKDPTKKWNVSDFETKVSEMRNILKELEYKKEFDRMVKSGKTKV